MKKNDLRKYSIPDTSGVYFFKKGRKVLYIGKATNLRNRVRSYFDDDLIDGRGPRIVDMVTKADRIFFETTPTVLEALVRESVLIKQYNPPANVEGKDDSTFLYVVITREDIPRVLMIRGKDIDFKNKNLLNSDFSLRAIYGPFPSGAQLKIALRIVKRIFPFFDTPKPIGTHSRHQASRIEFNIQIKQYPRMISVKEYRRTIRNVMLLLSGRSKQLRIKLARDMRSAIYDERFEDAGRARKALFSLNHIQDVSLVKDENLTNTYSDVSEYKASIRIESYDTAHLSGTNAIGVMAVLVDGIPEKRSYRTFRIRGTERLIKPKNKKLNLQNDDIASLREIITRRFKHHEWDFPQIIVVDGGRAQKKVAEITLKKMNINIPIVSVVKDERHHPREIIGAFRSAITETDAVFANSEAHRFSLARHRAMRSRSMRTVRKTKI